MKGEVAEILPELVEQGWIVEENSERTRWIAKAPPPPKAIVMFFKRHPDERSRNSTISHLRRAGFIWPPPTRTREKDMTMGALHEDTMAGLIAYLRKQEGWQLEPTPDGQWWRATPPGWLKAIRFPSKPTTLMHVIAQLREAGLVWPPPDRPRPQAVVRSVPFPPKPNPDVVIEEADAPLPPPSAVQLPAPQDAPPRGFTIHAVPSAKTLDDAYKDLREAYGFEQLALQDLDAAKEILASAQSGATKAQATYDAAQKAREDAKALFDSMLTKPGAT